MKKILILSIALLFTVTIMAGGGETPPADSPVAIMMKVVKDVTFKRASADWSTAKIGAALSTNDEIKTGSQSLALIKFTDNSILRVRENSTLKIYADKTDKDISKNTYIDKGKVGFQVNRQGNEEFKFTTPTMVASIRGTEGILEIGDFGTLFALLSGSANIQATQGERQSGTVTSGFYVTVSNNGQITLNPVANNQQIQNQLQNNNNQQPPPKRLIIKTNIGDIIIEYLDQN